MGVIVLPLQDLPHGPFLYLCHLILHPGFPKYYLAMQALGHVFAKERVNFHFADEETQGLNSK